MTGKKKNSVPVKLILVMGILAYFLGAAFFSYSYAVGPNYRNVSVDTTVNITQSLPTVLSVVINGGATNITLNAGTFTNITCNSTIQDWNGGSSIVNVSATFYLNSTQAPGAADNNNTHYSNTNCTLGDFDSYTRNVSCSFLVQYYANYTFWICNVTDTDSYSFENASRFASAFNTTHIEQLLALNVTPLIDYGNLAVGDQSAVQEANVTNFGNVNINISVYGYGHNVSEGLAMYCDIGNISIEHEKFSLIGGSDLSKYTNLSNVSTNIVNLTVVQRTNASQESINTTYWILYVPPNPFGRCNGTVVFEAESEI